MPCGEDAGCLRIVQRDGEVGPAGESEVRLRAGNRDHSVGKSPAGSSANRHTGLKARDRCGEGLVKVEARITEKEEKKKDK